MTANPIAQYPQTGGTATLPAASAAGQTLVSSGAGTTYTAQTPGMTLISKQTLGSTATTVTFSSIPATYTNLMVVMEGLTAAGSPQAVTLQFNADAGANYSYIAMAGSGAGNATTFQVTSTSGIQIAQFENAGSSIARFFVGGASSSLIKTVEGTYMYFNPGFGFLITTVAGMWASASAITSLALTCASSGFAAGTIVSLYGLA